ncbi:PIG-L family deacetylase [Guptibacillus hwajinpoensis]|uniref:PIG-L family deacetylase n=1 Tax=Guptibacillus hwajinpoensis TaxID=208199 RepID=UPI001CFE129B|nr:PIG-L family deacetylase [Pseudalkalibacillus hwajinpoensis]WLR61022.1 PIG-L family deacetylase [Pseudalkalibacillus hwajinpoensis]
MKNLGKILLSLVLILSAFGTSSTLSFAENSSTHDVNLALWESVVPLTTTASFMNTGAHPDDERSHFLAYLSRGQGVDTSFLLSTRGQGGQNEIGSELGDGLGIIRTNELQASSKVLGIETFFLNEDFEDSIKDFGFSKTPEETLNKWGETETYERLIHDIRAFKPDIIMPSFRNVDTQHGHHRAMTLLTQKAFEDAADSSVFPEQLEDGLTTWQVKKLYLPAETEEQTTTSIQIGIYDEHYDMTYPQLGEKARYLHESQGMGRDVGDGPETVNLQLVKSAVGDIPEQEESIYENIPYDFTDYANTLSKGGNKYKQKLIHLQKDLEKVKSAYPHHENVLTQAENAYKQLQKLMKQMEKDNKLSDDLRNTLNHKLQVKEEQLTNTVFTAAQLEVDVEVADPQLTPDDTTNVSVSITNNGSEKMKDLSATLSIPEDWVVKGQHHSSSLAPGDQVTFDYNVKATSRNYYDAYTPDAIKANIRFNVKGQTVTKAFTPKERVALLPEVSVKPSPENLVINTKDIEETVTMDVEVEKFVEGALETDISLQLPEGWTAEPESQEVSFNSDEQMKTISFTLTPPQNVEEGEFQIVPQAQIGNETISKNVQIIQYDHIGTNYYVSDAAVNGVAFPLDYPKDLKIGYVDSGFDKVADQLSNVGMDITQLTEQDLALGDLSQYDTIVTGIRAYLSREDLLQHNERLLEYVNNGGHLVVQYNKPWDNWDTNTTAPYELEIGQPSIEWRVTDEDAPINVLKPEATIFNYPNKIKPSDWDGWVQERGLYFPMNWSGEFETYVSVADPGEEAFEGGILKADYGEGTYIYTNLVWYRQIQNQVPGGYRIFTNLVSYPYYEE